MKQNKLNSNLILKDKTKQNKTRFQPPRLNGDNYYYAGQH